MANPRLKGAKEITSRKLYRLSKDPEYITQSKPDDNSDYWMFFEVEGVVYKIKKNLFDFMK